MQIANLLHADDYQLITPGGACLSRQDYLGGIESGLLDYHLFEPASEIAVKTFDAVAVVRYQARIELARPGQSDRGVFWHTDVCELRNGRWQAVWSQATRIAS
jgi:phage baseplate assembly protein W